MKKAFIFDMDGVIIDSEPIHAIAKQMACKKYNIELPKEMFSTFVGRPTMECFTEILEKHPREGVTPKLIATTKYAYYLELLEKSNNVAPIHGLPELLQRIKDKGYKIGLASSSARNMIEMVLTRFNIKDYFEVIISGAELPKSKPDPAVYLITAEKLGVSPDECIVIEDATAGIAAAKAAGMYCIAYDNPNSLNQDLSKADTIVKNHDDIKV
jgi:beta-phosphoglucomutase family hydrolase